ncbi:DUF485 domain-containing protein [Actinomadura yumaensis]|uniref:DUF485 domain-containing protein n=1 Tax=Actinomadura TaxID=1988 RepID=UPI002814C142|nr:DUF485 domain-containing protein [Actinomadura sp. J1-007]
MQLSQTPEFQRLRLAFRRFVFPMTVAFLLWYLLYVVLSAYARGFMGTKVVGEINVALVFGLLQFVSTFLIAWAYERYARRGLEPLAASVRDAIPGRAAGGAAPGAAATAGGTAAVSTEKTATPSEKTETPPADGTATGADAGDAGGTGAGGATRAEKTGPDGDKDGKKDDGAAEGGEERA